jgi:PAS domain S-box-containing protein
VKARIEMETPAQPGGQDSAKTSPRAGETVDLSHLETFFAVSLDLLVIRDDQYKILKVNQAWERTLGYSAGEMEGQPMLSFIHPDDVSPSHATMKRIEAEAEVRQFVNRYRCRDGSYRHLEWRARQEGRLVYGVARDVTERLAL